MKCLHINKKNIYYALWLRKERTEEGWKNIYGNPVILKANVSSARGESNKRQFGESEEYTKTIVLDNVNCPISETSILWVDTVPTIKQDGSTDTPHDYIVKLVARSLNCVSYAIDKVKVS